MRVNTWSDLRRDECVRTIARGHARPRRGGRDLGRKPRFRRRAARLDRLRTHHSTYEELCARFVRRRCVATRACEAAIKEPPFLRALPFFATRWTGPDVSAASRRGNVGLNPPDAGAFSKRGKNRRPAPHRTMVFKPRLASCPQPPPCPFRLHRTVRLSELPDGRKTSRRRDHPRRFQLAPLPAPNHDLVTLLILTPLSFPRPTPAQSSSRRSPTTTARASLTSTTMRACRGAKGDERVGGAAARAFRRRHLPLPRCFPNYHVGVSNARFDRRLVDVLFPRSPTPGPFHPLSFAGLPTPARSRHTTG